MLYIMQAGLGYSNDLGQNLKSRNLFNLLLVKSIQWINTSRGGGGIDG